MSAFEELEQTGFVDATQEPIHYGCTIEHTGHGERYVVSRTGVDGYLAGHDGPILIPQTAQHRMAFKLNELRASKARVVAI